MNKRQWEEVVRRHREHLSEPMYTLLNILGFDGLYELSGLFGGCELYIPKQAYLFTDCLQQCLMEEYDGSNRRALSNKYGICTRTVYNIMRRKIRVK